MTRLTLKSINSAIQQKDKNLTLYKGKGYFYMTYNDEGSGLFEDHSISAYRLHDLQIHQWLNQADDLLEKVRLVKETRTPVKRPINLSGRVH